MKYRKIDLQQGSQEWLDWRMNHITATAASTIMGLNPYAEKDANEEGYSAIYLLWAEKVGLVTKEFVMNAAVAHGSATEEKAREIFVESTGIEMTPVCVVNEEYPFMAASLDGINEEFKLGLEIKCPKFFNSFNKQREKLPKYYYAQVQHQLFCVGEEFKWLYWSYFNNSEILHLVPPDKKFQEELLKRCILFQTLVNNKIQPDENLFGEYEYGD